MPIKLYLRRKPREDQTSPEPVDDAVAVDATPAPKRRKKERARKPAKDAANQPSATAKAEHSELWKDL